MRFFLLLALFFSSAFDSCYAEELVRSVGGAQVMAADSSPANCKECEEHPSDGESGHASHQDACQQCHSCHPALALHLKFAAPLVIESGNPSHSPNFAPQSFLQALQRPPKSLA